MESADFAERFSGWKITERQITEIKAGSANAIAAFISDNENRLRGLAGAFLRKRRGVSRYAGYEIADLLNQLFVDLPLIDFARPCPFVFQVWRCYCCVVWGGLAHCGYVEPHRSFGLDDYIAGMDEKTFADALPDNSPSALDRIEREESDRESAPKIAAVLWDVLGRRKITSEKRREYLNGLLEYVFADYTAAQIQKLVGGAYAVGN